MDYEQYVELGGRAIGYGLGVIIFLWTRFIVIRAWKVR